MILFPNLVPRVIGRLRPFVPIRQKALGTKLLKELEAESIASEATLKGDLKRKFLLMQATGPIDW